MNERNPLKWPSGIDMSIEEKKMTFDRLEEKIKSLGDIKKVVKNKEILLSILTSDIDRHLMCALFEEVNRGILRGDIEEKDLEILRSGWLTEQIINLEELVHQRGREIFPFEIGDKLNYISLLRDVPTLNASYGNSLLVQSIENAKESKMRQQLCFWMGSGLPVETKLNIAKKFLEVGNSKIVMEYLSSATDDLKETRQREEKKNKEEQMGRKY